MRNGCQVRRDTLLLLQEMHYEGHVFPPLLDTPSAVSKVLLQEAGKMKASQVREAMSHKSGSVSTMEGRLDSGAGGRAARQIKQAAFLQEVERVAKEERTNHLRWYVSIYGLMISDIKGELHTYFMHAQCM